tara:strand:- start:1006 stop:1494 length:489 start_codon:yes stop_codon:yes gene_type:complete
MTDDNEVKIYKASKELQMKAGKGDVNTSTIKEAEKAIEESQVNFAPIAKRHLVDLQKALDDAKNTEITKEDLRKRLTRPVMSLKSEGSMFGYDLVGDLANIMLSFLESIKSVDKTVIQILQAHHTTLNAVVSKEMKGDGGATGTTLKSELQQAIMRYQNKSK